MKFGRLVASLLFCVLFGACSNSHYEEQEGSVADAGVPAVDSVKVPVITVDSLRPGMMRIVPNGASVLLGDGKMRVNLNYEYSLGIHEVTCDEYKEISRNEDWYFGLNCGRGLPVSDVSYFEAVLFANAYSKANGYDTVYAYHKPMFTSDGRCVNLEGLGTRTDVDGFRLPTEAEWVMAASQTWNPGVNSWNSANSNFTLQAVCALPDSIGFCDFAGNALEMTNDWLGDFRDTVVENYVGTPTGNSLREKVVKGGSIANSIAEMNLDNRGDVYPVTASTLLSYMGFRLAFGRIPNAVWMNGRGKSETSFVKMKAYSSDIQEKIGTRHAKLVFRNGETDNLMYVDFSGGTANVVEIYDSIPVFHPEISPDGMKVAFCTGIEGVNGESSVYVRNLDVNGSELVKLDVKNAAIPRWHVDSNGDTSIVYVDGAGDNSDDAEFFAHATWMVPFSNGKFGKPKKVLNGAYHSGFEKGGNLAVSGARKLRVHANGKDEIWYNGEQACNASLSKDGLKQVLFLDFGGSTGRKFASEKYGVHERLLVADSSGKLIRAIPAPKGYSFDHSEWAGRENWSVATLVNARGEHAKLVLVNVLDSSMIELAEGNELWHPSLWVMPKVFFENEYLDLDSAGMYWDPILQAGEKSVALKMRMFWDMRDTLKMIAVGTSRAERGFDPALIPMPSLNLGYVGGDVWTELYLLDNYVVPHAHGLKYLIVEISPDLMKNDIAVRERKFFKQAPGYIYDKNHGFWKASVPENFEVVVDANVCYSSEDSLNFVNTRGFLKMLSNGWGPEIRASGDSILSGNEEKNLAESIDSLTAFIDSTQNKGFKIIGLVYPQSPKYAKTGSFGRYGVRRSVAKEIIAFFDSLASVYPHFILMDENKFGAHDYTNAMANDYDHLCAAGAEHLSARLDSLIKSLEK